MFQDKRRQIDCKVDGKRHLPTVLGDGCDQQAPVNIDKQQQQEPQ